MDQFTQAINWLNMLSSEAKFFRKGQTPSLDVTNQILDTLNRPDKSFKYRVVIGGTAGKGTVCRLIEDTLERHGLKTSCLVSPHLQDVKERIRIGGELISKDLFGECILEIKNIKTECGAIPTYYEALVLAGILAAKKSKAQVLICEVGMGGRLDAVNTVQGRRIAGVTFIGEDHLEFFNNSIEKLAAEKAAIFTEDSVLNISFEQSYCSIFREVSASGEVIFLKGVKSKLNKKMARVVCEMIMGHGNFKMRKVQMPGRWEKIHIALTPLRSTLSAECDLILEGAHSKDRFEYILPKLKKVPENKIGVFAMARNHQPKAFEVILPYFDRVIWTEVAGDRKFWSALELKTLFGMGEAENDPLIAFKKSQESRRTTIVMGSFYLCGVIRELFHPTHYRIKKSTSVEKISPEESM